MSKFVEISNFDGQGYQPLVSYGGWRVAVLRHQEEMDPGNLGQMERHLATDEIFILVHGACVLFAGGSGSIPSNIETCPMEAGVLYNVKKSVWHTCSLSRDAHLIIIENDDTGQENSEYALLDPGDRLHAQNAAVQILNADPE